MRKAVHAVVAVAVVLALAFASNPSPEAHREELRKTIAERSLLEGALGVGVVTAFASKHHSWGVASYTTVNGRVASMGFFGMVFVTT